ncbi:MAG: hypothetical protein ACUVRZ_05210 [Desulfobacca sp.]
MTWLDYNRNATELQPPYPLFGSGPKKASGGNIFKVAALRCCRRVAVLKTGAGFMSVQPQTGLARRNYKKKVSPNFN